MGYFFLFVVAYFFFKALRSPKDKYTSVGKSNSPKSDRRRFSESTDWKWIPPGESVKVDRFTIPDGMLYIGSGMKAAKLSAPDPGLIDPTLKIAPQVNHSDSGFWPSYSDIKPGTRAGYLQWLADGRRDQGAPLTYVFLYFYGLERRLLVDSPGSDERELIEAEITRLLSLYRSHPSFDRYATSLLEFLRFKRCVVQTHTAPPSAKGETATTSSSPSAELRIGLSRYALERTLLPADWALSWVLAAGMESRAVVRRCGQQFGALFLHRYKERFPKGIVLRANKTMIAGEYRPASGGWNRESIVELTTLPDVTVLKQPIDRLLALADDCCTELDSYSRFIGRNPDKKESTESWALLPEPLLHSTSRGSAISSSQLWLEAVLTDLEHAVVKSSDLLKILDLSDESGTSGKRRSITASQLLEKMGFGLEPDVRFDGPQISKVESVVVFRTRSQAMKTPGEDYRLATLLLHLGCVVAQSDGVLEQSEQEFLEKQLERWLRLSLAEATRLRAHLIWLKSSRPSLNRIRQRLSVLSSEEKEAIANNLVSVAQADGIIDPSEMKSLTKIYELLGLSVERLFSSAHAAATKPVLVSTRPNHSVGYAIPAPNGDTAGSLDFEMVTQKLAETATVSALLKGIFLDEPIDAEQNSKSSPSTETATAAVSAAKLGQRNFGIALLEKRRWSRSELEELSEKYDILLDGTLDLLNEAAFDKFSEPLFEGEDPLEINTELGRELLL